MKILACFYNTRSIHKAGFMILLLVFVYAVGGGISFAAGSPAELDKKIVSYTLDNGMKILMLERHISPTVSFYIRHRVGAVDEDNGKTGIAHLLEHMLFKGTQTIGTLNFNHEQKIIDKLRETGNALDIEKMKGDRADKKKEEALTIRLNELIKDHKEWIVEDELDRIYTENGATDINASTGQDLTTYHVSLPSNKIELWARIEADRMTNPVFRGFYSERNVVMEERKQRVETDPDGKLYEHFLATAFMVHPYRNPIVGWNSDVSFLGMDDTETFFKKYHAPNNTVIAIVGDIDPVSTLNMIKKYFGAIPYQDIPFKHVSKEPPQAGERRIEVVFDANPQIIIGHHKPNMPSFDDYAFDVIQAILSEGRTSRFYKKLVTETRIAESIQVINGIPGSRHPNLFVIYATPRHPHTNAELETEIYAEIERLKKELVTENELKKIKNRLHADFIRGLDSNAGLAGNLSYFESLAGTYRYMIYYIDMIEKVTPEDVMRTAQKYLTPENRTVAQLKKLP